MHFTCDMIYALFNGSNEEIPPTFFSAYVDAR
jgi:hypothetical protein